MDEKTFPKAIGRAGRCSGSGLRRRRSTSAFDLLPYSIERMCSNANARTKYTSALDGHHEGAGRRGFR